MVLHHTNFYQPWVHSGAYQSWLSAQPPVPKSSQWTMHGAEQTHRNDWQLLGSVTSWIGQEAAIIEPGPGGGGVKKKRRDYDYVRAQILREDDEILEIIAAMISKGVI